jgi:RNA polymerase sigma-70 factor (ECF subfamily)
VPSGESLLELALETARASAVHRALAAQDLPFVCRYTGNVEEAQDLTQDTFTKAFQNLDRLSDPSRFSSWLYKIALNECRMRFRRRRNVSYVSLSDEDDAEKIEIVDAVTPEQSFTEREMSRVLREAFRALPEEQQEVILMKVSGSQVS